MSATHAPIPLFRLLLCGALVVTLSMGVRHGFGLWLQPITQAQNWSRETFAMGMAVQNLTWGLAGIFSGMLADRFGASRVLIGCGLLYALGLVGMSYADTPTTFALTCGVLIGMAQAGTTYPVVYGVIGRNVGLERRSWAMGMAAAAGSFGQFLMAVEAVHQRAPQLLPITPARSRYCGGLHLIDTRERCLPGACFGETLRDFEGIADALRAGAVHQQ